MKYANLAALQATKNAFSTEHLRLPALTFTSIFFSLTMTTYCKNLQNLHFSQLFPSHLKNYFFQVIYESV